MNNKSHDFYLNELLILSVGCFDILEVRSKVTVKTSVCWVTTRSVEGIHILKMESIISFYKDTKYPLVISLMGTGYSGLPL